MRQEAEGFAQSCEALARARGADLAALRAPAHIVTGEDDPVCPPSEARLIGGRIRGAKVTILNRCGHWPMLERPAESANALKEFLSAATV